MNTQRPIDVLIKLAGVRYAHMAEPEKRAYLEAVMLVGGEPEAGIAAETLAAMDRVESLQLRLDAVLKSEGGGE